ncbi:MAG: L-threonylcarbamoyladenylate synthase [Pseudomonadota bacterium]
MSMTGRPDQSTAGARSGAQAGAIADAAAHLLAGGLVAFPTETVYGLGADATNGRAVAAIYEAKSRPAFNPLIAHVPSLDQAAALVDLPDALARLGEAVWPGPLTVVAPVRLPTPIAEIARAGLPTLAVRCPDHEVASSLLAAVGRPLVAPSANRSGHVSATTADHVRSDFEGVDHIRVLDGGPTVRGLESTIVGMGDGCVMILRPGALTVEDIADVTGARPIVSLREPGDTSAPNAPGQLESHYAPRAKLVLIDNEDTAPDNAARLTFAGRPRGNGPEVTLSASGDPVEAAANLFGALRRIDDLAPSVIAAPVLPESGLGVAINDRLRRAAAPRI